MEGFVNKLLTSQKNDYGAEITSECLPHGSYPE